MTAEGSARPYFDSPQAASVYDDWYETSLGRIHDRLEKTLVQRLAQPVSGECVLDVGTGTGTFAIDLAKKGLSVTGFDRSAAMLAVATTKHSGVEWQQGQAEALPYPDGSFDLVVSITALEFVQDPELALAEMYRVVKPGGRLLVGVLNGHSSLGRAYGRQARTGDSPFATARFYTARAFVTMLRALGPVRWNSTIHFGLSRWGARLAGQLEWLGQRLCPSYGAVLMGRVDK